MPVTLNNLGKIFLKKETIGNGTEGIARRHDDQEPLLAIIL